MLDPGLGVVHELADRRLLGLRLEVIPTRLGRHPPEDAVRPVLIGVFGITTVPLLGLELACCSSNASEMYFKKISPKTTCLYSAASMLPRRASAICQSAPS